MPNFNHRLGQVIKSANPLLILFFLTLFLVPLTYIVTDSNQGINWVEGRTMVDFELGQRGFVTALRQGIQGDLTSLRDVIHEQFVQRAFLKNIEDAAADQFPLRLFAIRSAKAMDRMQIGAVYAFLPDPAFPADMHSEYVILRDGSAIIPAPVRIKDSTYPVIDERISNYQSLIDAHPGINFYAYYIERIENSKHHPLNSYFNNLETGQYFEYFTTHEPEELILGGFFINSFEDHQAYFYQTDHHLNVHGILLAYHQIYELLSLHYPEISPEHHYDQVIGLPGVQFRGTAARKTFTPMQEKVFEVVDYALPPHKIYEHGEEITYGSSAEYLAGIYPKEAYFNHYEGFFGGDRGMIEFEFEGQPERSLLIFGNSYDNALLPLIASHYQHTYDVDIRYYPDFSLSVFLSEHEIDDILIIGENSVVFSSRRYQINP